MCDAMTLLHAQHTHSQELPRSVGRDINDVALTSRQVGATGEFGSLFGRFIYVWDFHVNLS
jgi:hypothetical protein